METEKTDQQRFDEHVNRKGKVVLQVLAGVGVFAALLMSIAALIVASNKADSTGTTAMPMAAASVVGTAKAAPTNAAVTISHTMRGCHTLAVNGGPDAPTQTVHLAAGGTMNITNNDVMPHTLIPVGGQKPVITTAAMTHLGASSAVKFPKAGTYTLGTKAGEDYTKGVVTVGPDNTLKIKVVVA